MRMLFAPIFVILMILIAFSTGKYAISLAEIGQLFREITTEQPLSDPSFILLNLRLPRILAAVLVGGALAISGATYQGMFRNPLVSPDILGVSAGAGLGAVIAIYFDLPIFGIQLLAFICGLVTVFLVYLISQIVKRLDPVLALVLSGVAISALLAAGISLIKLLSDPYSQLTVITFWLMGSLTMSNMQDLLVTLPLLVTGILPLIFLRWRMNLLSLQDEEAKSLGVNVKLLRLIFIFSATLLTSAAVAVTGIIGWIGLVIPHMARLLVGPDFRKLMPTSLFMGAGFLLLTDTVARAAFPIEMPLSILTAFIGAPFFIGLLIQGDRK